MLFCLIPDILCNANCFIDAYIAMRHISKQKVQQARAQQIKDTAIIRRLQVDENAHQDIEIGQWQIQGSV
jgi:hypothetical protein